MIIYPWALIKVGFSPLIGSFFTPVPWQPEAWSVLLSSYVYTTIILHFQKFGFWFRLSLLPALSFFVLGYCGGVTWQLCRINPAPWVRVVTHLFLLIDPTKWTLRLVRCWNASRMFIPKKRFRRKDLATLESWTIWMWNSGEFTSMRITWFCIWETFPCANIKTTLGDFSSDSDLLWMITIILREAKPP